MADGSLSQEDIDAILGGGGMGGDQMDSSSTENLDSGAGDFTDLDSLLGGGDGPSSADLNAALGGGSPMTMDQTQSSKSTSKSSSLMGSNSNLNLLLDVTMSLTVELGRTNRHIKDILQIGEGSVVELDKMVGDEVDLLANGKLIGRGKLVIIDEYYGVTITYIVDPMERLKL